MAWTNGTSRTGTTQWKQAKRWAQTNLPHQCNTPGCNADTNLQLDHITPKYLGGTDDTHNLQWLCTPHHAAKTAEESRRARGTRYRRPPQKPLGAAQALEGRGPTLPPARGRTKA